MTDREAANAVPGGRMMLVVLHLHTTRFCGQTPRVVFAFEELGLPWRATVQDDGYFLTAFGVPGPMLEDGDLRLLMANAIVRHVARTHGGGRLLPAAPADLAIADMWMDFYNTVLRSPVMALMQKPS